MKSKSLPQPKKKGKQIKQPVNGPRSSCRNVSLHIECLKGIKNATIKLSSRLTAIMGVNGAGKTTIIHALACLYSPIDGNGTNYKFTNFFIPTTKATWKGSKLSLKYEEKKPGSEEWLLREKEYKKEGQRWTKYDSRPKRNVTYLGIDTCMPEIECTDSRSTISLNPSKVTDKNVDDVIKDASYILDKPYTSLLDSPFKKRKLIGVENSNGLMYSSLSMGSGEQRTIRILRSVYSANKGSMILIDELDLLLHVAAFRKLIVKLNDIAERKDLQIVFTTHSPEIFKYDFVTVQYLYQSSDGQQTNVSDFASYEMMIKLVDDVERPLKVYVEDTYSKCIVNVLASSLKMKRKVDVIPFGAAQNAFTIACSKVMEKANVKNVAILLDGDVYITEEAKLDAIGKKMSGEESWREEMRKDALKLIMQYTLPEKVGPEEFLHDLVVRRGNADTEVVEIAQSIITVDEKHNWVNSIVEQMGMDEESVVMQLIKSVEHTDEWKNYVKPIENWLLLRKNC